MAMEDTLPSLLTEVGDKLNRQGYSFLCPTPETHSKVIARLVDEGKGQSNPKTESGDLDEANILTLEAKTLQDIWGWSLPFK